MKPKQAELEVLLKLAGYDTSNIKLYPKCKSFGKIFSTPHTNQTRVRLVKQHDLYPKHHIKLVETNVVIPCEKHLPMLIAWGYKEI